MFSIPAASGQPQTGRAAPRSADRLSRSRNSFYCQKLAPVKGPHCPSRDRVSQHPLCPHTWGAVPGSVLAAGAKPPMLVPGAAPGAEAEACPVSISPCMGEEGDVSHPEPGGSAAVSLLGAPGPCGPWLGTGALPSGHHLVQPQALQLLHQVPAEDAAPARGSVLSPGHGGLTVLGLLAVQ